MQTKQAISLKDFSVGLILALAEKGVIIIDKPRAELHKAVQSAYDAIQQDCQDAGLRLRFHIITHEIHGDSLDVDEMIMYALYAGLAINDSPGRILRITINKGSAQEHFTSLPGEKAIYMKAARTFIDYR